MVGLRAAATFSQHIGFQIEANYTPKGFWAPSYALNIDYLEIPALIRWLPTGYHRVSPVLVAGVANAFKMSCREQDAGIDLVKRIYQPGYECAGRRATSWDAGLVFGAGVAVGPHRTRMTTELRFTRGLRNVYGNEDGSRGYNQTIGLLVGLSYAP